MRNAVKSTEKPTPQTVPSPADLFSEGLEAFKRGDLPVAAAYLRAGFFENLYIAPLLLDESIPAHSIWHASPAAEVKAAEEYARRFGAYWDGHPEGLSFLGMLWNDPLVRNEIKSFVNLGKSLERARDERQRGDLLRERQRVTNFERIKRTQREIFQRISNAGVRLPAERPFLGLIMLSSLNPIESVDFYRTLFELEPIKISNLAGGYAEFELDGVHIAIHGYNQHGHGDPYRLGPPPSSLGWGAFFVIRVADFDRYYANAVKAGLEVLDCDTQSSGRRFFVVKDPSGYVFEITEEELRGLQNPS